MSTATATARPSIDNLLVSDVTGQKTRKVSDVPVDSTVGELINGVLADMKLPRNDSAGRDIVYHGRLDREGRHLHSAETVGESLQSGDALTLTPNIDAGAGRSC